MERKACLKKTKQSRARSKRSSSSVLMGFDLGRSSGFTEDLITDDAGDLEGLTGALDVAGVGGKVDGDVCRKGPFDEERGKDVEQLLDRVNELMRKDDNWSTSSCTVELLVGCRL